MTLLNLSPTDKEKLRLQSQAERQRRQREGEWTGGIVAHSEYQGRPVAWMVEKLGIPEHMIRWSLNPEYAECMCLRCHEHGNQGRPHLWDGDPDPLVTALELIFQGKSVAVSSGTTTSKTFTIAAAGTLCFLALYERSTVYSLAPKKDLLLKNMWKEVGELWPRFKRHFPTAQLLIGQLRMLEGEGQSEVWSASAFGAGVGADEELAQRLKGFHRAKMMWVLEEGPGLDQAMVETVIKTASAEFNPIVMLGNPEHQHDTLARFAKRPWVHPIRISALDFPNVVTDREVIPGGRSRESVLRDLEDSGGNANDSKYLGQVRGIAPKQSKRALIKYEWLEAAAARFNDTAYREGPLALGGDPADSIEGDEAAISRWQGACCTEVQAMRVEDASEFGKIMYREITDTENPIDPRYVGIDRVGIGASTINTLKGLGLRVRGITGNARALARVDEEAPTETSEGEEGQKKKRKVVESEIYANERSQVFWRLREDLRLGRIALARDVVLWEEMTAIEFEEPSGKITVMPKKDIKAILGRSPNRADAVAYGNFVRRRGAIRPSVEAVTQRPANIDQGLEQLIDRHAKQGRAEEKRLQRALRDLRRAHRRIR